MLKPNTNQWEGGHLLQVIMFLSLEVLAPIYGQIYNIWCSAPPIDI
jgi:hypothetical protein